jgi:hypothetical protein
MTTRDFRVGDIVTVKGYGEFRVFEVDENYQGNVVYHCEGHGLSRRWFHHNDIVGVASIDTIITRHKEAAARKLSCDTPDCWCRSIVDGVNVTKEVFKTQSKTCSKEQRG